MAPKNASLMRALRSAPSFSVTQIADSNGVEAARMLESLAALPSRGRCAQHAAALTNQHDASRAQAAAHRAVPPPTVRAAGGVTADVSSGAAGWAGRRPGAAGIPRAAATRTAVSQDHAWKTAADPDAAPLVVGRLLAADFDQSQPLHHTSFYAASNPACPQAILLAATRADTPFGIDKEAAANPSFPSALLAAEAASPRHDVQCGVAKNPGCDEYLLRDLASRHWEIAVHAALNPACPPDLIEQLSNHDSFPVRLSAAASPHCPPQLVKRLVDESNHDWEARQSAARSPVCPSKMLERLAGDDDADVRSGAASNPRCHQSVLSDLADDNDWETRSGAAANPALPEPEQMLLAVDEASDVRHALALNPGCAPEVLAVLAVDDDTDVSVAASRALRRVPPLIPESRLSRSPAWNRSAILPL